MKEIDDTPTPESEYEHCEHAEHLARHVNKVTDQLRKHALVCESRIKALEAALTKAQVELADLHFGRRVSRQQADDQDPEWFA